MTTSDAGRRQTAAMTPHEHPDGVDELDSQPAEMLDHLAEQHGYAVDAEELGDLLKMSRVKHQADHTSDGASSQASTPS
ncbi:MAG: hypothetical protein JWO69_2019 [Thermoleophilia bacterium]|nr:hypothetical protein [Thermoleophilia bacterium]